MSASAFRRIILCVLTIGLMAGGCKRDSGGGAGGNSKDQKEAAASGPISVPRDPLVGIWKVSDVQAPGQLPPELANMVDTLKTGAISLHADHTFRFFNGDAGGYSGAWNSDGKTITLTKGSYQKDQYPVTKNLTIAHDQLMDANDSYTTVYTELPAQDGPPKLVSITDFLSVKDDASFKSRYFDKPVEIEGIVHSINGFSGIVMLRDPAQAVADAGQGSYAQCYLANGADYGKLANGQSVTLRGIAVGDAGSATIEDCQIETLGSPTAVSMSAIDLANEFAKDPDAAMQKYAPEVSPKTLFLSGPVLARNRARDPVPALFLGSRDAMVQCTFTDDDVKRLASLKIGDEVHVAGNLTNDGSTVAGLENCYLIPRP